MKITEVRDGIINGISDHLADLGFDFKNKQKCFQRTQNDFVQIFDLLFHKEDAGVFIEPIVRLKSNEIEGWYHKVSKKESQYNSSTMTLGNNMFKIIDFIENGIEEDSDEKKEYLVEVPSDIPNVVKAIIKNFRKYVLAYFDQNSSVQKVDELLNNHPKDITVHNWLYPMRACIAIIAAKLNNNPKFSDLTQSYQSELEEAVEHYKTEFIELKKLLEKKI